MSIKNILKAALPNKIYNIIRTRPRPAIISNHLYNKIKKINKTAWLHDPDNRGDVLGILRKQAHILDKGLQSNKRESGHGRSLAMELQKNLEKINSEQASTNTAIWAQGIATYHSQLQSGLLSNKDYTNFPFLSKNALSFDELFSAMQERRSIRHFRNEKPQIELITKALRGSVWAPSSCNRQTIVLYLASSIELSKKCASYNKGATSLSGSYLFISVCFDTRSYHLPHESLTGFIDASLGFQNSLLLLHSLGLGACVLNWSHSDQHEEISLRQALNIPDYCEIAFNVIVGIPAQGAPTPGKKSPKEFILEIQ